MTEERSRHNEWWTVERIVCYLDVFANASGGNIPNESISECKNASHSAAHLSLNYPTVPTPPGPCPTTEKPCASGYISAEYGSLPANAQAQTCVPCPGSAAPLKPNDFHVRCAHDAEWQYILDYSDDRSSDDIPDDPASIVPGFTRDHAYYIGNAELEKLDLKEVQMCALSSSQSCEQSCYTLTESLFKTTGCNYPDVTSNLKKLIAALSGQCVSGHFMEVPDSSALSFSGSWSHVKWQCHGYRLFYGHNLGGNGNWHAQGWGLTLRGERGAGSAEFGWWDGHCGWSALDVDTFQIRAKLNTPAPLPSGGGQWNLGANIDPCDGHNMGYGGPWASNSDVGSSSNALTADFLDNNVWNQPAQYITIARHQDGACELSKTWKLTDASKSMYDYFSSYPGRIYATGDGSSADTHIHSDMSASAEGLSEDPIFGADGGLAFNWYYSNNGARIANPGAYKTPFSLPGTGDNNDDVHGLGNEYGASTSSGGGSGQWWHDVGKKQGDCHGGGCKVVGTDKGSSLSAQSCWGSVGYAIYVSNDATQFSCQGQTLSTTAAR